MNSKQLVLTGLIVTSLLAAMAASDVIPPLFMSFIVLAGGITATFYIALSQKRMDRLADFSLMLKAGQEINSHTAQPPILDELLHWIKRLIQCEAVLLCQDGKLKPDGEFAGQPGWEEFLRWIGEKPEPFLFNHGDKTLAPVALPEQIKSLLAVPLHVNNGVPAWVLLINEQSRGCFNEQDREFVQYLGRSAVTAWEKARSNIDMENFHLLMLKSLVRFLESQDRMFLGHAERVAAIAEILGRKLGLDQQELNALKYAALLHDVGRFINIPDKAGEAAGESEPETSVQLDLHSLRGAECLPAEGVFIAIREGVLFHHERYDGSGYPEGLVRTEIPLNARIIAVADIYDAMTRLCPEEERLEHHAALSEIKRATGSLLDPLVVVVMEEADAEVEEIAK